MTAQVISAKEIADQLQPVIAGQLQEQVAEAVKTAMAEFERKAATSGHLTPDGGTADKGIKNFGDFLVAVKRKDVKRLEKVYGTKALEEQDGTAGGYLVPEEFNPTLMQFAQEVNPIDALSGASAPMVLPMTSRTVTLPALDQTQNPGTGASATTAGVVARWTAEAASIQETEPVFSPITLNVHKLAGYTKASMELEADSAVGLAALLARLFGQAVGYARLYAFLRGTGVGQPKGVNGATCAYGVTRGTGAAVYETADLLEMYARLTPGSRQRAVWFVHPLAIAQLGELQFGSSDVLAFPMVDGAPMRLLGRPAYEVEFMSAPGTAFDLLLADWSYYLIGQRAQTAIAASEHAAFLSDEMTWKFTHRVDGQPWLKNTRKLADGANTVVSPFVYLS